MTSGSGRGITIAAFTFKTPSVVAGTAAAVCAEVGIPVVDTSKADLDATFNWVS